MSLETTYLGLRLRTPLVPSAAAPLSESLDNIKRLEDAGAPAVVLYSLFEEQIRYERYVLYWHMTQGTESYPESLTYFPEPQDLQLGAEAYLRHIQQAKKAVLIPIIASLNGSTLGGWTGIAKQIEDAGADALELIEEEMKNWMLDHEYESVEQLKGSLSHKNCEDPSAFERAQYMRALRTFRPAL